MKNSIKSHPLISVFIFFSLFLTLIAIQKLPKGSDLSFIVFSFISQVLIIYGFIQKRSFFQFFLGVFLWLGLWFKFCSTLVFLQNHFSAPVGFFNPNASSYNEIFITASIGILGFLLASYSSSFLPNINYLKLDQFDFKYVLLNYETNRKKIIFFLFVAILIVSFINIYFGIYQRGLPPRTYLPLGLNKIITWLELFGLSSFCSIIVFLEFKLQKNPLFGFFLILTESLISSVSILSRGMILNTSSNLLGGYREALKNKIQLKLSTMVSMALFTIIGVALCALCSNVIRAQFSEKIQQKIKNDQAIYSQNKNAPESPLFKTSIINDVKIATAQLITSRWVGIEGLMSVSGSPKKGWKLFLDGLNEDFNSTGTSFYDTNVTITNYDLNMRYNHFINIPGVIAFFYYSGSKIFVFISTFLLGLTALMIETFAKKLSYNNLVFTALVGQLIAYRYAHFGNYPKQSYLLFSMLIVNTIIIHFSLKSLNFKK